MVSSDKKTAREEARLIAKAADVEGFTKGIWRGNSTEGPRSYVNYTCSKCQFETVFLKLATDHFIAGIHAWKRATKRTRKTRIDKGAIY